MLAYYSIIRDTHIIIWILAIDLGYFFSYFWIDVNFIEHCGIIDILYILVLVVLFCVSHIYQASCCISKLLM